jgi:hypothetical protein
VGAVAMVVLVGNDAAVRADDAKNTATGDWKWEMRGRGGNGQAREVTLKLKQDGEKLTGTITGFQGQATAIKEGTIKKGEVSFEVTRERNGNTFTQKYKGKLEGDTIKGTVEFEINGETRTRPWEAKRSTANVA